MLDIWTPIVKEEDLHPNFNALKKQQHHTETLKTIQSWTEGFVDRDNKIIQEFQKTFNSSFWEFYLNAAFRDLGFEIDFTHDRPDFLLKKSGLSISAEATIASHPDGAQPEWVKNYDEDFTQEQQKELIQLAMIRLSNAICAKHRKLCEEYSQLDHVKGKPFILCVAPFEQPQFFLQSDNAIRKILYKYDAPLYIKNEKTGEVLIVGEEYVDSVLKDNGTEIELGFFTDDRMKEVSAIVFSSTATATKAQALKSEHYPNTIFYAHRYDIKSWDKPKIVVCCGGDFKETLLDGLHIFFNPYASFPLDPANLIHGDITYHDYDAENRESIAVANDGALLSHSCFTVNIVDSLKKNDINKHEKNEFVKKVPEWKNDNLYSLNARVGDGVNNHIAHYKGWTIIVFQDDVDKDWSFMAKPIVVFEIQKFLLYTLESIGLDKFYLSKDKAYEEAKKEIDSIPV